MLQLNASQAECDTKRLTKDWQVSQAKKLSSREIQLQKEAEAFISSQPELQALLECLQPGAVYKT